MGHKGSATPTVTPDNNDQGGIENRLAEELPDKNLWVSQWQVHTMPPLWRAPDYFISQLICANRNNDNLSSKSTAGTLRLMKAHHSAGLGPPSEWDSHCSSNPSPGPGTLAPSPSIHPHLTGGGNILDKGGIEEGLNSH